MGVELFARVIANVGYTSGATNDAAVPQLAVPVEVGAPTPESFTLVLRQTRFGGAVTVREVLGGTFDADVDLDLFGGRDAAGAFPLFPVPRLRTARAALRWARTSLMVGSETPLISDLDPLSLAAVGVPNFSTAGNLWNWLPQVRASQELGGGRVRWAVQGAVIAPFVGVPYQGTELPTTGPYAVPVADAGERSGLPFLQARLRARWGGDADALALADVRDAVTGEGPSEIGFGVHRGWVQVAPGESHASSALAMDVRLVLRRAVELRGEAYVGQLVQGLGGGAIGQSFGRPPMGAPEGARGEPLRNAAGWAQLNVRPTESWLAGVGCGVDRVREDEQPVRRRNLPCAAHVRWQPIAPVLLGFEYRRLATWYDDVRATAHHFNLALGFEI